MSPLAPWIQTAGGRAFDFLAPSQESIDLGDIAHALGRLCRFNGHVNGFYSVAEHSVLVSRLVAPEFAVAGLLHDAAEAYIGDVTKPLKDQLPDYQRIEAIVEQAIAERFGLPVPMPPEVKIADTMALAMEHRDLMPGPEPRPWSLGGIADAMPAIYLIECLSPWHAQEAFLERAHELGLIDEVPDLGLPQPVGLLNAEGPL